MAAFDFQNLLNNQPFMFGMNLLGQSRNPQAMSNAVRTLQTMQQMKAEQAQQEALRQQQALELEAKNRAIAVQEAQAAEATQRRKQIENMLRSRGFLPPETVAPEQAPAPQEQEVPDQGRNPYFQPNPFNGFPPADTDRVGLMRNADMQRTQAPAPKYEAVNPDAVVFDYAMNEGKNIGKFYQEATNPIVTRDGAVLLPQPDGSYKIAPGSLEAQQSIERMREATKAEQDPTTIVLDNGQSIEVTRLQKSNFLNSGVLPPAVAQRLGAPAQQPSAAQPASGNAEHGVPSRLLDNLKQTESSGNRFALNSKTKAMGAYQFLPETVIDMHKQGIEFNPLNEKESRDAAAQYLSKLYKKTGSWEGALKAYGGFVTKDPSQYIGKNMRGVAAPVVTPSRAAPRLGITQAPEVAVQNKQVAEGFGKDYLATIAASKKASAKLSRANLLESYLSKVTTGVQAPTVLGLQKFAAAAGFKVPPGANYAEAASALSKQVALEMRDTSEGGGLPGQMSNYEDRLLQSMVPGIDKLPGANRLLLRAYKRQQTRLMEGAKLMARYRSEHGVIDDGVVPLLEDLKQSQAKEEAADQVELDKLLGGSKPATPSVKGLGTNRVEGRITGPGYDKPTAPKFLGFE
jgi:hypothetical protein